jgi:hypothetical protein
MRKPCVKENRTALQFARVEDAFQQRAIHQGDRGVLEESLEGLAELQGCRPCVVKLSCCETANYQ